ncbi:hypothetical protein HDV63DRAFT_406915 [Trichoderma sp. SZMC 28014]
MSSPEALAPAVFSGRDLLALDEDKLVKFLNDCRTSSNDAAAEKAGPFNADELSGILGSLIGHDGTGHTPSRWQSRRLRSPTLSPNLEDNRRFEALCHDELVKAGGRPIASFELFLDTLKDVESSREMLMPWLGDKNLKCQDGDVPPVFSAQLDDWESFQHKWQWDNRGKYAGDEGFAAFLDSRRKRFLHKGETGVVSNPSFEDTARRIWQHEERYLELSGKEGFTAYTQAVEKRLASHQFMQPFQLAEDPRQQDPRTTWVEYLGYTYWRLDRHAAAMRAAEPRYRRAWDELQRFNTPSPLIPSTATGAFDEELDAVRAQLETTRQQLHKFIKDTKSYRRWETAVRCQELRVQWVLEQLSLIDTATSAEYKATKSSSSANSAKKRKARDEHDAPPRQLPKKRRQQARHTGSTLEPGTGSGTGTRTRTGSGSGSGSGKGSSEFAIADETAATTMTTGFELRRSRRLGTGAATKEALSSQLQSVERGDHHFWLRPRRRIELRVGPRESAFASSLATSCRDRDSPSSSVGLPHSHYR